MNQSFQVGVYARQLTKVNSLEADRVTYLLEPKACQESLRAYCLQIAPMKLSLALNPKQVKNANLWRGVVSDVTLLAHKRMHLREESLQLLEQGFRVRIALPSNVDLLAFFELSTLRSLDVDFDLMAFDYVYPRPGIRTQLHTQLFAWEGASSLQTLQFLKTQGISLQRVHLGLTSEGVLFKNVEPGISQTGYGQPCHGDQLTQFSLTFSEIASYLKNHPAATSFYTSLNGCFQSFIYNPANRDWISCDDIKTIQSKTEWAQRQGLAGIFRVPN